MILKYGSKNVNDKDSDINFSEDAEDGPAEDLLKKKVFSGIKLRS